jgi:hypothetical protein
MDVSSCDVISVTCSVYKKSPGGVNRQGCERILRMNDDYSPLKFFQAVNRLLALTEPKPLAKLQPACAA